METIIDLTNRLEDILKNKESREIFVNNFIDIVLNLDFNKDESENYDLFISLASRLEFYEPNDEKRIESDDFFGDEKLEFYVIECLQKLN